MTKTILITGATDGIGLETARMLAAGGHTLLVHGRNPDKLTKAVDAVAAVPGAGPVQGYLADLSELPQVETLARAVLADHRHLDALINNAGVLKAPAHTGMDLRLIVNTLAPILLTHRLLGALSGGRVVNVSSAAQAPVNMDALAGGAAMGDMDAYAQSKLALTMWTAQAARAWPDGPMVVAVNPGSLLGTKMVKQGFGMDGGDISVGADILARAALSDEFADASGLYYDNDAKRFGPPHRDAQDRAKCVRVTAAIQDALAAAGTPL